MIYVLGCDDCVTAVRILGDLGETARLIVKHRKWADGWPCVRAECPGKMRMMDKEEVVALNSVAAKGLITLIDLSPEDAFRALCGLGLPSEIGTDPEVVSALLLSSRVVGADISTSPSGRSIVRWLQLENGLRIHLSSSSSGAAVFKITRTSNASDQGTVPKVADDSGVQGESSVDDADSRSEGDAAGG